MEGERKRMSEGSEKELLRTEEYEREREREKERGVRKNYYGLKGIERERELIRTERNMREREREKIITD